MADDTKTVEQAEQETPNTKPAEQEPTTVFKDDPAYKAMAQQIAEMRRKEVEREAAEEAARKEAEIKELESRGQYEEAIKARDVEVERLKAEIEKRELTTELLKAGFTNDLILAGAVAKYSPEKGTFAEYVAALSEDEANAVLLGKAEPTREPKGAPPKAGTGSGPMSNEQLRALGKSSNPADRLRKTKYLREYMEANNGQFPPGYLDKG